MSESVSFDRNSKFVSLGGVFSTHTAAERPSKWPDIWVVPQEAVVHEGDAVEIPPECENVTIGPEITAVVGESMHRVGESDVADSISGFTISTDVTAKGEWPGYSYENHEFITGTGYKIFPTFRPVLSKYEPLGLDDVRNLHVEATVDGKTVVEGYTTDMGFSIPELFSHVSKVIKLNPGDLVALGDPGNPEGYIDDASTITSRIEKIGELTNTVQILDD